MALVDRVKNICLTPNTEWPVIAAENTPSGTLISGYVLPLAAIGAVAGFLSATLIGGAIFGSSALAFGLTSAVLSFVVAIVVVVIVSLIINALAPSFGGEKNSMQAMKVAVYSFTPAWVAGAFQILPILGSLVVLLGALYGLYLLYLGLPRLMKSPEDKTLGYTVVVVLATIFVYACLLVVGGVITGAGMLTSGALSGLVNPGTTSSSDTTFDKDSPLGKLEELGRKLEESGKKMDAAEKAGDSSAQVSAALEGLGTLLGGGRRVDPLGVDQLKSFVPDQFAGLPKTRSNAEKTGIAGLMVSKAEATYGDGARKEVTLELSDAGGMSGLVGLASWAGVMGEKDNDDVAERTEKIDGRFFHQSVSKRGGPNEFAVVLGERFVVSAKGDGVTLNDLKSAVGSLDLAKLEGMKNVGVQK